MFIILVCYSYLIISYLCHSSSVYPKPIYYDGSFILFNKERRKSMRKIKLIAVTCAVMLIGLTGNILYSQDDNIPTPRCVCAECEVECGKGHASTCSSNNKSMDDVPEITDTNLTGKWVFKIINGIEVIKENAGKEIPFITFNKQSGNISGYTGCNTFDGNVNQVTDVMSFSQMTTTKMFCPDASYEIDITSVFFSKSPLKYNIDNGVLALLKDEKEIMKLEKSE